MMSQATFTVGNLSVYHVINADLANNKINWCHMPPDVMC